MNKSFSFSAFNENCSNGIFQALLDCNDLAKKPIFICIGSDLVLGDSLGPLIGTILKKKRINSYVYGTLNFPITAKEVETAGTYLENLHPNSIKIAIDAAIGNSDDVGLIKVFDKGLKPGLGVNKNLKVIGDVSIIAVVAGKSIQNHNLFNLTRLNLIYEMAEKIANGIEKFVIHLENNDKYIEKKVFGA